MSKVRVVRVIMFSVVMLMIMSSCKTKKPLAVKPIEAKNRDALLDEMKEGEYHFETISAKASVEFRAEGKKSSIKAALRMKRDSAIWINFSYIGFAGARVLITPDSVKIIDYRNSRYMLTDLDYINKLLKIDIDFPTIQSLIVGNSGNFDFFEDDDDDDEKLRTALDKNRYFLSTVRKRRLKKGIPEKRFDKLEKKQEKNPDRQRYAKKQERKEDKYDEQAYSVWLDTKTRKILKAMIKDFLNEKELTAEYSDFRDAEGQLFPYRIDFQVVSPDTSEIKVDYSKITKDKEVDFTFNIPDKYEQISE